MVTAGQWVADRIALEAGISLAAAAETGTHSEGVPGVPRDTTAQVLAPVAAAVAPVWAALEVEAEASVVVVVDGAGKLHSLRNGDHGNTESEISISK